MVIVEAGFWLARANAKDHSTMPAPWRYSTPCASR